MPPYHLSWVFFNDIKHFRSMFLTSLKLATTRMILETVVLSDRSRSTEGPGQAARRVEQWMDVAGAGRWGMRIDRSSG